MRVGYDRPDNDDIGTVMGQNRIKRRVTRIQRGTQLGFDGFEVAPGFVPPKGAQEARVIRFEHPDPREIRFDDGQVLKGPG